MKKCCVCIISLLGLVGAVYGQSVPGNKTNKDSVVVNFGNKTRMILVSEEKGGIQNLQKYDFNEILKDVGIFTENAKNKETYLFINDATGKRYLKDTTLIVTGKDKQDANVESRSDSSITRDDRQDKDDYDDDDDDEWEEDRHKHYNHTDFSMDLGLNLFMEGGKTPSHYNSAYGLRPLGSRYVAFSIMNNQRIGGEKSPFFIRAGLELAWNNFMFEGNNYAKATPEGITFPDYVNESGQAVNLDKTKLTVCYLSIPVIPTLQFYNKYGRKTFKVGAGGYAGLRLASYTKVKYKDGDNSITRNEHGSFYLNDFRYGLIAQVGIRGISVFAKYDLNPLFDQDRGPKLNALNIGITVFTL
jgi:hypothetical protein